MFLKQVKNYKGIIYLYIAEGYRDENGRSKHRHIKNLGSLDSLKLQYSDPISHFNQVIKELEILQDEENTVSFKKDEEMLENVSTLKYAGYLAFKPILAKLNLSAPFNALNAKYECKNSIYDVFTFLVFSQIINPSSKQSSYSKISRFLEGYNFSEDQLYRSLSYIGPSFESIVDYLYESCKEAYGLNTSTTHYDGTNFYFEIDREDDFKKKGPCKDKTSNPIVGIGLLTDADHIPIDVTIYPGNESEKPHFVDVIKNMKEKHKITGRTIFIADKGLNFSDSIYNILSSGNGYIFSRTIKGASEELKMGIENLKDWHDVLDDDGEVILRYSSYLHDNIPLLYTENGRKREGITQQQHIVTWNKEYADKAKYEREKLINKANKMIKSPKSYTKDTLGKASSYLNEIKFDKNGEIIETESKLVLNQDKINEEAKFDGYYMLVTSELKMKPLEVIKTYRRQSFTEELFRVQKTFLKIRPVYLQRQDRIKAHVLVCYAALLLIKILETKILENKFTIPEIINGIKDYNCALIAPNKYHFFEYNTVVDTLARKSGSNARIMRKNISDIKKLFVKY